MQVGEQVLRNGGNWTLAGQVVDLNWLTYAVVTCEHC